MPRHINGSSLTSNLRTSATLIFTTVFLALASAGCGTDPITPAVIVAKDPLDVPAPISRSEPATVEVTLIAKEVIAQLDDGTKTEVWTFNGTVPGPLIRVRQGDDVIVTLVNEASNLEPHSIDLHAVIGPGGGDAVTEVEPGKSAQLRFRATTSGTFLYHCAAERMPWEHVAHGMYGAILVEPEEGLPPVGREVYVAESEWYLKNRYAQSKGPSSDDDDDMAMGGDGPMDVLVLDEDAARAEQPSFFTLNGHVQALSSPALFGDRVHVAQGERVRIIFANAGPNLPSSFHVMGEILDRVWTGPLDVPLTGQQTALVPPGAAIMVELATPVPGTYPIMDHALYHAERGAMGNMHVDPVGPWPDDIYGPEPPRDSAHGM